MGRHNHCPGEEGRLSANTRGPPTDRGQGTLSQSRDHTAVFSHSEVSTMQPTECSDTNVTSDRKDMQGQGGCIKALLHCTSKEGCALFCWWLSCRCPWSACARAGCRRTLAPAVPAQIQSAAQPVCSNQLLHMHLKACSAWDAAGCNEIAFASTGTGTSTSAEKGIESLA